MDARRFDLRSDALKRGLSRRALLGGVGVGLAAATVGRPLTRTAAQQGSPEASPAGAEAGSYRFTIGAFAGVAVSDGGASFPNPTQILFTNAPAAELAEALREFGAPDPWEAWNAPFTPMLVEADGQRVLIDTGIGANVGPTAGKLQDNLAAAGVAPEDIDVVILTNGHPDHVGGATDGAGRPAFPRARYVMSRLDWEVYTDPEQIVAYAPDDPGLRDLMVTVAGANLPPLRDRIELVEDDAEIVPGVRLLAAPGHTPGHVVVEIASDGERLLHGADTVLHPLHFARVTWLTVFDALPTPTVATRRDILARAAAEETLMAGYHLPFPGLGRAVADGDAWRWEPIVP